MLALIQACSVSYSQAIQLDSRRSFCLQDVSIGLILMVKKSIFRSFDFSVWKLQLAILAPSCFSSPWKLSLSFLSKRPWLVRKFFLLSCSVVCTLLSTFKFYISPWNLRCHPNDLRKFFFAIGSVLWLPTDYATQLLSSYWLL